MAAFQYLLDISTVSRQSHIHQSPSGYGFGTQHGHSIEFLEIFFVGREIEGKVGGSRVDQDLQGLYRLPRRGNYLAADEMLQFLSQRGGQMPSGAVSSQDYFLLVNSILL